MKPINKILFFYILLLCSVLMLLSCNTSSKLDKLDNKDKLSVAKWVRDKYPCVPLKPAPTPKTDSIEYKKWKAETDSIVNSYETFLSSITPEVVVDSFDCTEKVNIYKKNESKFLNIIKTNEQLLLELKNKIKNSKPIIDSFPVPYPVKDSAGIYVFEERIKVLESENKKLQSKVTTRNKIIMWLFVILGLTAVALWLRSRIKPLRGLLSSMPNKFDK